MSRPLTRKQAAFVQEYLIDLNATQAAIRAGYSKHTAKSIGQENLTKPAIVDAISVAMDARAAAANFTTERILQELARIAFFDESDLYDGDGNLIPIKSLPSDITAAMRTKPSDKRAALELLGKYKALFTEKKKIEHSGQVTMASLLSQNDQGGITPPPQD